MTVSERRTFPPRMAYNISRGLKKKKFELREARALRRTPSRRLQALVGEHAKHKRS